MNYEWCGKCYIFGFNYCCSRNRDRDKCFIFVVKGLKFQKGVVDSEKC